MTSKRADPNPNAPPAPVIVFLDETGDHSLEAQDKHFPFFAVALLICNVETYVRDIVPAFYRLKYDLCGHEGLIFHSRDIRKRQKGFEILNDAAVLELFYMRINDIMGTNEYTIICSVIKKQKHKQQYGMWAKDPYDLALTFCLERLLPLLESIGQDRVMVVAEARGKVEDLQLRASFQRVVQLGTSFIASDRFSKIQFKLEFLEKKMNIVGTQMADLVAYPTVRQVLDGEKPNPAYEVFKPKFYVGPGQVRGLKIFP